MSSETAVQHLGTKVKTPISNKAHTCHWTARSLGTIAWSERADPWRGGHVVRAVHPIAWSAPSIVGPSAGALGRLRDHWAGRGWVVIRGTTRRGRVLVTLHIHAVT